MSYGPPGTRPSRFPHQRRRRPWLVAVGALVVLALCCCAGLLVSTLQRGEDSDAAPSPPDAAADSPSGRATAGRLTVPDLVGVRLPDAEARLKALGFAGPRVVDATGRGRVILARQNWVVRVQQPAAGTRAAASTTITLRVGKPTDAAPTDEPVDGEIPDVVCRDLQTAQDTLQAAGFFVLSSVDGSGQGRRQLIDRNWVVLAQSAAPGSRPARSTRITLTVVKLGEPSPRCPT